MAVIILGINRGFDFSDEGLYQLLFDPNQSNQGGIFNYDLFFKLIFKFSGIEFGIVGSRWIRLLSYFLGAYFITLFWKNFKENKQIDLNIFIVSLFGLLAGYSFLPPSLSYNSLSVVLACIWLYLVTLPKQTFSRFLKMGIVLALLFYVKITSYLLLGILTIGIFWNKSEFNWKSIIGLVLPIVFFEVVFYLMFSESGFLRILDSYKMMGNREDYSWGLIFKNNAVGVFWSLLVLIPFFITSLIKTKIKYLLLLLSSIFGIWIFYKTKITDEWSHMILIFSLGYLGWILGQRKIKEIPNRNLSYVLLLFIFPFCLHFGSNVYFLRIGIHYWHFWILACFILLDSVGKVGREYVLFFVPFITLILLYNGIWLKPFGEIPLSKYDQEWEYKPGKKINLTKEMVSTLADIKGKIKGIPNQNIIALYRNPGWLVLLGLNAPKNPGIWDKDQSNSFYPDFPKNFDVILYFSYQNLPDQVALDFYSKSYQLPQGELKLLWRK